MHEDDRTSEDIVELLQRSLSVDETQSPPAANRNTNNTADGEENSFLVGSSDSSVEGYRSWSHPVFDPSLN